MKQSKIIAKLLLILLIVVVLFETIILSSNKTLTKERLSSVNYDKCKEITNSSKKKQCWESLMEETLQKKGLDQAFALMDNLFQTEPNFAANCHDFAHLLGQKAYALFSSHQNFNLSPKSSYCGYGFYHGFMETLLHKTTDMDQARKFCEYADQQLNKTTSDSGGACYHGIGHGTVDGSDPRFWGDTQGMIKPSLELCEKVSSDENPPPQHGKLYRCVSGAFNALEILSTSKQYRLSLKEDDPFWICKLQPERYKEACYTQFVVGVMSITKRDFVESAKIINTIVDNNYALPALQALVVERVHDGKTDYLETINFCRNLPNRFHLICITAFGDGFLKYGPPQSEYIRAVDFCSSSLLSEAEQQACFDRVLAILRIWYTAEKSQQICQSVDKKYQHNNCRYN